MHPSARRRNRAELWPLLPDLSLRSNAMKTTFLPIVLFLLAGFASQATMSAEAMPRGAPWMNLWVERVVPAHSLEELNDPLIPFVLQQISNFYGTHDSTASPIELARFLSDHFDQVQVENGDVGQTQFVYRWVIDPPTGEMIRVCSPAFVISIGEGNSSNPILVSSTVEVFGT